MEFKIGNRKFQLTEPTFGEMRDFKSEIGIDLLSGNMDSTKLNDSLKEFDGFIHIMSFLLKDEKGKRIKDRAELENWLLDNAGMTDFRRLLENFTKLYQKDSGDSTSLPIQMTGGIKQ